MPDRAALIDSFLSGTRWTTAPRATIAGDASARRYLRLGTPPDTAILMDADPATGEDTRPFTRIARYLTGNRLCAPVIIREDAVAGLLLLGDLGPTDFAAHIRTNPDAAPTLYAAATDVLIAAHGLTPPDGLTVMDPDRAAAMLAVVGEWYLPEGDIADLQSLMHDQMARLAGPADRFALRDFHAENLIWRTGTGLDRVGLLDFQDAFVAPAGYDLASLLRDARRAVDPAIVRAETARFAAAAGLDPAAFTTAFHLLAVQRNLRILGIFARLVLRDAKPRYLAFVGHVWRMIGEDLAHPALSDLQSAVSATLPPPDASRLKGLL
jgi:aminoglycoside/choline kinase family phosphotransferase